MNIKSRFWILGMAAALFGCGSHTTELGGGGHGSGYGTEPEDPTGITCTELTDFMSDCFDQFCAGEGASTAFCGCWTQGQDLNIASCECMPLNLGAACTQVDLDSIDPSLLSCQPSFDLLGNICTG